MAFEVVSPRMFYGARLQAGRCRLTRNCELSLSVIDLETAGIEQQAVVLADVKTMRIAVRKPRPGEETVAVAKSNKSSVHTRSVRVRNALGFLGIDGEPRKLRELPVECQDGLIIVQIDPAWFGRTIDPAVNQDKEPDAHPSSSPPRNNGPGEDASPRASARRRL